jgi:hypothetical protein
MPSIAANRETALRVTLAAMLFAGAVVLATAALMPRVRMSAMLAARAPDGVVSTQYVDAFRGRALVCAVGLAIVTMLVLRYADKMSSRASKKLPCLSPATRARSGGHVPTPAEAGVYCPPPPTAAESSPRSGLQEIATGFSRWKGSTIHRVRVAGDSQGPVSFPQARPDTPSLARDDRKILFVITLIGAIARAFLLTRPLHYDEAFTLVEYAWRSPLFFLTRYTHPNNHVLHTLLVWLITRAGDALWLARLPAFLAGVAVIPATYLVAARIDQRAALIAAGLVAGATPLVEYSAQARGYTILVLCVLLLYALRPGPIAGGLLIAAGAWTIPVMAYAAAGYLAWRVLDDRGTAVRTAVVAAVATFVLYVPILVVSGPSSVIANGNVLPVPYDVFLAEIPPSLATMWREWNLSFTWVGGILLAIAAIAQRKFALPPLCAVGVIGAMLVLTHRVPFARVWIFLLPLFLIAAACGLARAPGIVAILLAALTAANAVRLTARDSFFEDPAFAHTREIAAYVARSDGPLLVVGPLDAPLAVELRRAGVPASRTIVHRFDTDPSPTRAAIAAAPRLRAIASESPDGRKQWRSLAIPNARPVHTFDGATLYEVKP